MPEDIKTLRKYFSYLEKERRHWDAGIWRDVADNLFPYREDFTKKTMKGGRRAVKIYNSAPMIYLNIFAEGLHGNMINEAIQWFILRLPAAFKFLEEISEVRQWLQDIQEMIYYYLQESNFYSVMRQYFKDGGSIGTAYLTVDEDIGNDKLVFYCLHPRECYIAENQFGRIDVMFRRFDMTARAIKQKFGEKNLTPQIQQSLKNNPFAEHEIIHAVYPNDEFDKEKLGNKHKAFASKYFVSGSGGDNKYLSENGYNDFPFMTWRYYQGDRPPYGESPATFALPEIMGLQVIGKTLLRAGHLSANPAHNIPSEMEGSVDFGPGGHNYYGPDFNRKITPVTSGINYPISQDREDKKEEILKRHFHVDYFLALEQAERQMTAREVIERMGEKAAILSSSIGDLTSVLDSIIDYIFNIKNEAFKLPPPPPVLMQHMAGRRIPIEYMGPLAQAQKRLFETRGLIDGLNILAPYFELFPEWRDIIRDNTPKDILKSYGFPQTNINDSNTIDQIRKGRALQQQEEMSKIDMQRMSDTIKALAQANKNSPAMVQRMAGAIAGALGQGGGGGLEMPQEA